MARFSPFRKPKPAIPPNTVEPIPGARGPVTSHQAAVWAQAAAVAIGPHTLHLVQSGQSILPDGRSHTWEFMLRFPGLGCTGLLSVQPADPDGDPDSPTLSLWREFLPLPDAAATPPSLPEPWSFADSPDVVAALARAGADFVAGPTDMGIRSFFAGDGTLHWRTDMYDSTIDIPDGEPLH
jgi:hypothetical protein